MALVPAASGGAGVFGVGVQDSKSPLVRRILVGASLLMNLGLLAFFFFYAIAFTWLFDRVFGLPESVQ